MKVGKAMSIDLNLDWASDPEKQQNSESWLRWRMGGIGASDAPVIMKKSPWATPYQLWLYKTGREQQKDAGFAAARGHRLEPIARAKYCTEKQIMVRPTVFEHATKPHFRASLDGYNADMQHVAEIKCPGEADYLTAKAGTVPEKYFYQLMHQYFVTGAQSLDYVTYYVPKGTPDMEGELVIVPVSIDIGAIEIYLGQAEKFWNCVLKNTPPAFTERDFVPVKEIRLSSLIKSYSEAVEKLKFAETVADHFKAEIISYCKEKELSRVQCENAKIYEVERKGSVRYAEINELKSVNLELYRAPEIKYFKIDLKKEG